MFCPQCGSLQSDELKFCKACGANLSVVRRAVATRESGENFNWSKTWVAEMFMSSEEAVKRQAELERLQGITPEIKRYREIKAGVITGCAGIGLALLLFVLMEGIVMSGVSAGAAEILSRLWIAGVIPFMVGIALIINGLFVSKRLVEIAKRDAPTGPQVLERDAERNALRAADTAEFIPSNISVTEGTTKHLNSSGHKQ